VQFGPAFFVSSVKAKCFCPKYHLWITPATVYIAKAKYLSSTG